uniref:Uncharacterized protein n=1 Tax=Marseillevirus LCMAC101 TaxID=2506602 RepID=A0A481YSF1_9VIRU|nr:MAG: hypothetical protein LCMAC101_04820 [Marseillevirus LCMAC101]
MNNESIYLLVGIIVVIIAVMMWNNRREGIYFPQQAPNQVWQGDYTNSLTGDPRVWSCPPGTSGVRCPPDNSSESRYPSEGYRHSGMEPASDHDPINIIAPPFTDEVWALQMGVGPGLLGSGRFTSEMYG